MKRDVHPQERIARELLTQRPLYIGTDGENAAHYWDSYERAMVVVPADADTTADAERHDFTEIPISRLSEWAEHVRTKRGWDTGPRICDSLVDHLETALSA